MVRRRPHSSAMEAFLFLRPTLLAILAAIAVAAPTDAMADAPAPSPVPWMPSTAELSATHAGLAGFDAAAFAEQLAQGRASAESCRLEPETGAWTCRCVRFELDGAQVSATSWRREAGRTTFEHLRLRGDDRSTSAALWTIEADEDGQLRSKLFRPVFWRADRQLVLATKLVRVGDRDISVEGLGWHPDARPAPAVGCGQSPRPPESRPRVTAFVASWDGQRWVVWPFYVGDGWPFTKRIEQAEPAPITGLLPPQVVWSRSALELTALYYVAPAFVPQASVAVGDWYGAGLGVQAAADEDLRGLAPLAAPDERVWVEARLVDDELSYATGGQALWGTPYVHASAALEAVGRPVFWRTERVRQRAFFRPWRTSQVGASASGIAHSANLRTVWAEQLDGEHESALVELQLVGNHHPVDWLRVETGADHLTLVESPAPDAGAEVEAHRSTARVVATAALGEASSAWARPGLVGWFNGSSFPRGVGADAQTQGQVLAVAETGLHLVGRFDGWRHRVRPRLVVGREVGGFASEDVGPPASNLDLQTRRTAQWTQAMAIIEQAVEAPGLRLSLPVAAVVDGAGLEATLDEPVDALAAASLAGERWEVGVRGTCELPCDEAVWAEARARAIVSQMRLSYAVGRLSAEQRLELAALDAWPGVWTWFRLRQLAPAADPAGWTQWAQAAWLSDDARSTARLGGFWDVERDDYGLSLGAQHRVASFGWGVGLFGAWRPAADDWGLGLGFGI